MNKLQRVIKLTVLAYVFCYAIITPLTVQSANLKPFAVIRTYGYDDVLIADSNSYYFLSYGYGCSSYDFPEGGIIYIDTYYTPSYFNDIYISSSGSYDTCGITNSETIDNPHPFYVQLVNDSDNKLIVTDQKGNHYFVDYGIGCSGIWNYEGNSIYIDIGGSYLDGISDTIYLFGRDQSCRVWDGESISEPKFPSLPDTTPVTPRPLSPIQTVQKIKLPTASSEIKDEPITENPTNDELILAEQSDQNSQSELIVEENQSEAAEEKTTTKSWISRTFTAIRNWIVKLFS